MPTVLGTLGTCRWATLTSWRAGTIPHGVGPLCFCLFSSPQYGLQALLYPTWVHRLTPSDFVLPKGRHITLTVEPHMRVLSLYASSQHTHHGSWSSAPVIPSLHGCCRVISA